jgi:hypothetical protein
MKRITMADLNYVMHRSTKNIIEFPTGSKLPDMKRPLTEGEARVLCIMEAVLSITSEDITLVLESPSSDSINEQ